MPGSAIGRFESTADYAENLRELEAVITPTQPGPFEATLIRVELPLTRLIDAQESAARIGFLSIPRGWRYALFATQPDLPLLWNAEALSFDDVLLAGEGRRLHQRTAGAARFGAVAIRSQTLQQYFDGLAGGAAAIPAETCVIHAQAGPKKRLLHLHARIVRTIQSRPGMVCHPEAARAIEQELIEVLVTCLVNGEVRSLPPSLHSI